MSSGKPTEICTFALTGLKRQIKTLKGEIDWSTMKNIIADQEEGTIKVPIIHTIKEMENLKEKNLISIRKVMFLRNQAAVEGNGHKVKRKEDGIATGAWHVVIVEVHLLQEIEAERVAKEGIVELAGELLLRLGCVLKKITYNFIRSIVNCCVSK